MIHSITIDSSLSVAEVAKLSRKFAMTGGYELILKEGISDQEAKELYRIWFNELRAYKMRASEFFASNAYRILTLLTQVQGVSKQVRDMVNDSINIAARTIFIIDDEPIMLEVCKIVVEEHGGTAIGASSGEEALTKLRSHQGKIDCFFIDFSMPRMNGLELYKKIAEILPQAEIKVVFSSGLQPSDEIKELLKPGKIGFISKPFDDVTFLKAVRELL